MENKHTFNWEKAGVYLAIAATFFTVIIYIADMKERIAVLEVKQEVNHQMIKETQIKMGKS